MFNSKGWSKLSENTYGYKTRKFCHKNFYLFYSHVINDIGEYIIAPSFGDFISIDKNNYEALDLFSEKLYDTAIRIKICSKSKPLLKNYKVVESGFIHQIEFNSYSEWRKKIIKAKFRNQIVQPEKKGIQVELLSDKKSLYKFYEMHSILRINKFNEIPQPWKYFECIYKEYFLQKKGYVIQAFDPKGDLIAGILFIISGDTVFYKFTASYLEALKYRPNNLLMDRLIQHCDSLGIKKLNLGFTGSSDEYKGLRQYKTHAGAKEYKRFILETKSFSNIDMKLISRINNNIKKTISSNPSMDEINKCSNKYYKFFI